MVHVPLILIPTLSVGTVPAVKDVLERTSGVREAAILIGPEGDFTRDEVQLAQAHGARPVSLGRLTLRSETAALAMLVMLSYTLQPL